MKVNNSHLISSNLDEYTIKNIKKVTAEQADLLGNMLFDIIFNRELDEKQQFKNTKKLIKQGANINIDLFNDDSLLIEALSNKRFEVAKLLIQCGADVSKKSAYGTSPIYYACIFQNYEMVNILTEKGALKNYYSIKSPLIINMFLICDNPSNLIIHYLLENGIDVNATDVHKNTALFFAAGHKNKEVVIDLLEHGANPLIKNYNNITAYDVAVKTDIEIANIIETYEKKWEQKLLQEEKNQARLNGIFEEIVQDIIVKSTLKKEQETVTNQIDLKEEKEPNK